MEPLNLQKDSRHTFFVDVDGVLVKHNYLLNGDEDYIQENIDFLKSLGDVYLVLATSRKRDQIEHILSKLSKQGIEFDIILTDLPTGIRFAINDYKELGKDKAVGINIARNTPISQEAVKHVLERISKE